MEPKTMNYEVEEKTVLLLADAEGTVEAGPEHDRLDELAERLLTDEFYTTTDEVIPCKCMDCRTCGRATEGPNAAGGSTTIFVADDLTTKRFASEDGSVVGGMRNTIEVLQGEGHPIGTHTGPVAPDDFGKTGCGGNDKLDKIYNFMGRKPQVVRDYVDMILDKMGQPKVEDETHELIVGNARGRDSFPTGQEILDTYEEAEGAQLEALEGKQNGVIAVINLEPGKLLNRKALAAEFGPDYQAFDVDAWSFPKAAEETSLSAAETRQKVIAMAYYNVTAAHVIGGPNMRVMIRP